MNAWGEALVQGIYMFMVLTFPDRHTETHRLAEYVTFEACDDTSRVITEEAARGNVPDGYSLTFMCTQGLLP